MHRYSPDTVDTSIRVTGPSWLSLALRDRALGTPAEAPCGCYPWVVLQRAWNDYVHLAKVLLRIKTVMRSEGIPLRVSTLLFVCFLYIVAVTLQVIVLADSVFADAFYSQDCSGIHIAQELFAACSAVNAVLCLGLISCFFLVSPCAWAITVLSCPAIRITERTRAALVVCGQLAGILLFSAFLCLCQVARDTSVKQLFAHPTAPAAKAARVITGQDGCWQWAHPFCCFMSCAVVTVGWFLLLAERDLGGRLASAQYRTASRIDFKEDFSDRCRDIKPVVRHYRDKPRHADKGHDDTCPTHEHEPNHHRHRHKTHGEHSHANPTDAAGNRPLHGT